MNEYQEGNKKAIILKGEKVVYMDFEEVIEKFKGMIKTAIRNANSKIPEFKRLDPEDFQQLLLIQVWKAFEEYEVERGNCFSTYLHPKLQDGCKSVLRSAYAQKNDAGGMLDSLDGLNEEGNSKYEIAKPVKEEETIEDTALVDLLKEKFLEACDTDTEKELLTLVLLGKKLSIAEFASKHHLTRQGANSQKMKLQLKLKQLLKEMNYSHYMFGDIQ